MARSASNVSCDSVRHSSDTDSIKLDTEELSMFQTVYQEVDTLWYVYRLPRCEEERRLSTRIAFTERIARADLRRLLCFCLSRDSCCAEVRLPGGPTA